MSKNPIVITIYFLLELVALAAIAYGAWQIHPILGILAPVLSATAWGVFRVPNEPGKAPIAVSGVVRLILEAAFFGLAVFLLTNAGQVTLALALASLVLLIYALSYDRVIRFVKHLS